MSNSAARGREEAKLQTLYKLYLCHTGFFPPPSSVDVSVDIVRVQTAHVQSEGCVLFKIRSISSAYEVLTLKSGLKCFEQPSLGVSGRCVEVWAA